MRYIAKHYAIILLVFSCAPVHAFELLDSENQEWFNRCEMSQPGFEFGSIYKDHIKHYFSDKYNELKDDEGAKKRVIDEFKAMHEMVQICYPRITFLFQIDLSEYDDVNSQYSVEKIDQHQSLVFKNTIYSSLPAEYVVTMDEFIVPKVIKVSKVTTKMLSRNCTGISVDKPVRALLEIDVKIKRVGRGKYEATPETANISAVCPGSAHRLKSLVKYRYKEG